MADPRPKAQSDALIFDSTAGLERLREIMARLRDRETGCPWDIEQDFRTIAPYTIEEAYEVADAIEREAWGELPGELGDLLLQVIYYTQMAEEEARFSFQDVVRTVSDKMVSRHPHVFGDDDETRTAEDQTRNWEAMKAKERGDVSILAGVAMGLPGLTRAVKLQKRAARVGFDWPTTSEVLAKLREEMEELVEAEADGDPDALEDEFGDLVFVMANLARHLGVDPEAALRRTNAKFERRFGSVEEAARRMGRALTDMDLAEMDALWDEAKRAERKGPN